MGRVSLPSRPYGGNRPDSQRDTSPPTPDTIPRPCPKESPCPFLPASTHLFPVRSCRPRGRSPCQIRRKEHGSRQRPRARRAAVPARPSGQRGGMAGKDAIAKGRRKAARIAAIPGKQVVRYLLGFKKDFFLT